MSNTKKYYILKHANVEQMHYGYVSDYVSISFRQFHIRHTNLTMSNKEIPPRNAERMIWMYTHTVMSILINHFNFYTIEDVDKESE